MPKAKVDDIQLYYEEQGRGEPLLLVMGLGASTLSWSEQIPTFGREFRVIAFDNRGAGRSDKPAVRYNIALFADDTAGLMDALGIDSAHVYGQSMGGFIAQELALRHPQRVRTLVLGSTSCGGRRAVVGSPENLAGIGMMNVLTPREAAEKGLPLLYSEEFIARHRDALIQRSLREAELRPPPDAFGRQIQAADPPQYFRPSAGHPLPYSGDHRQRRQDRAGGQLAHPGGAHSRRRAGRAARRRPRLPGGEGGGVQHHRAGIPAPPSNGGDHARRKRSVPG